MHTLAHVFAQRTRPGQHSGRRSELSYVTHNLLQYEAYAAERTRCVARTAQRRAVSRRPQRRRFLRAPSQTGDLRCLTLWARSAAGLVQARTATLWT